HHRCHFSFSPFHLFFLSDVQFFQNGYKINATGALFVNGKQQLQIKEASANDAARYSCIAENKVGSAVKDLVVSILKPPKMQDRQLIKEVQQSQQLVLECPIEDSYAEFSWRKNDFPVSVSNKVQVIVSRNY
ncbi:unnamed protein product, partial [Nippostrongylus brasiliensis]|uniref:I-set domain-containing protein n=1 Tax=Nippostrongylus brasiliensis TaxID=27835 RepID=A0A0N4XYV5_NIPBR